MASESTIADSEGSVFQVLEGVVYYMWIQQHLQMQ